MSQNVRRVLVMVLKVVLMKIQGTVSYRPFGGVYCLRLNVS